jgi:hypothetical protein
MVGRYRALPASGADSMNARSRREARGDTAGAQLVNSGTHADVLQSRYAPTKQKLNRGIYAHNCKCRHAFFLRARAVRTPVPEPPVDTSMLPGGTSAAAVAGTCIRTMIAAVTSRQSVRRTRLLLQSRSHVSNSYMRIHRSSRKTQAMRNRWLLVSQSKSVLCTHNAPCTSHPKPPCATWRASPWPRSACAGACRPGAAAACRGPRPMSGTRPA